MKNRRKAVLITGAGQGLGSFGKTNRADTTCTNKSEDRNMKKLLFFAFIFCFLATSLDAMPYDEEYRSDMPGHVFVVSEWLPKENCEEELWDFFKELMSLTKKTESGCIRAHATRQIPHPGAPGKSKYKIILLQEYEDIKAFDIHCHADYVKRAFKKYIENEETALVKEWNVRLFSEDE